MKFRFGQPEPAEPQTPVRRPRQTPAEALPAREETKPLVSRKTRENLAITAIVSVEIAAGAAALGIFVGVAEERPQPFHPDRILEALDSLNHRMGHRIGYLDCAVLPDQNEVTTLIDNTREVYTLTTGDRQSGLDAVKDQERFAIADKLGFDLVPNDVLDETMLRLIKIGHNIDMSDAEKLEQTNAIASEYLMDNFDLGFEFVPNHDPDTNFNEALYSQKISILLYNMSVLPKQAYDERVLWKIKVNANTLPTTVRDTVVGALYHANDGTIEFASNEMDNSSFLVHELWHTYEALACPDGGDNVNKVFGEINPPDFHYVDNQWLDNSDTYPASSVSAYASKNAQEDFAESGQNWALNTNANFLQPDNLSIPDKKSLVAAAWADRAVPNLAEYISTVSRRFLS